MSDKVKRLLSASADIGRLWMEALAVVGDDEKIADWRKRILAIKREIEDEAEYLQQATQISD